MRAYYINLDRRPDRKEQVETELHRVGLEPVRVEAVDGKLWDGQGWRKQGTSRDAIWRGGAGCWFSHIRALETAIAENQFPCLVVEDDVVFKAPVPTEVPYPMTLLGGNRVKGKGVYTTHCILYSSAAAAEMYLNFLKYWKSTTDGVSVKLQKLHPDLCGALPEFVAFQRDSVSDIQLGRSK